MQTRELPNVVKETDQEVIVAVVVVVAVAVSAAAVAAALLQYIGPPGLSSRWAPVVCLLA